MRHEGLFRFGVLLVGSFALALGAGQMVGASGSWGIIGPWGGEMNSLTQAPLDPDVLFAACFGLFKSTDGGATWHKLPVFEQRIVRCVAAAGSGAGLVSTAYGRRYPLFVSTDGGDTWSQVQEEVFAKNEVYHLSFTSHSPDGGSLVACTSNGLFASSDGMSGWQKVGEGIPATVTTVHFTCSAPGQARYYFACGQDYGVYRSEQLESGWQPLDLPAPDEMVDRVAVQWDDRTKVLACGDSGVFRSTDGGTSWETVWSEQTNRVAIASSATTVVYASGGFGLVISPDSGQTWLPRQDGLVIGNYVSGDLLVSPQSPYHAWLASFAGVYWTEDAGGSWDPSNQGIFAWGVRDVAVSDRVPGLVFASCVGALFRKTQDMDWQLLGVTGTTIGLSPEWVVLDPTEDATVYAWTGRELIRSHDMGNDGTWETVLEQGPGAHGLAIDPETGDNLYLATMARGVMASHDGGQTWDECNSGLPVEGNEVWLISIAPSDPNVLWAGLGGMSGGQYIYKTTDGAQSWATAATMEYSANCIVISPDDPDTVYLGGYGVQKTTDGGGMFLSLSEGLVCMNVADIAIDPRDTRKVYAAVGVLGSPRPGFGLYQLDMATGLAWEWVECSELEDVSLMKLAIDPWAEDRVVCAFAGNSLWAYKKTAGPPIQVSLSTDRNQYAAGDTQIARISATNTGADIDVDLYVAIMLPDGSLLFWPGFGSEMSTSFSMTPMPRGFSMSDVVFFNMALPYGLPGGNYTWFGRFYGHGTQDAVSNLASAGWTFLP